MRSGGRQHEALLATGRWFRGLSGPFRDRLLAAAVVRELPEGRRLFSRGDPPFGLYAVIDGGVRITSVGEAGEEALLMLAEAPTWLGAISAFDGLPVTHDAIANAETTLLHVPPAALAALLDAEPRWWRELGLLLAAQMRLALWNMEDQALLPIAARLARRLVMMCESHGEWQDRCRRVVALKQEQLGLLLAASRQTVNQVLKDMEAKGLIRLTYGGVVVEDLERLRRVAHGNP